MYEIKLKFLPVMVVAATVAAAAEPPALDVRDTVQRVDVGRQEIDERGGALLHVGLVAAADGAVGRDALVGKPLHHLDQAALRRGRDHQDVLLPVGGLHARLHRRHRRKRFISQ